MSVNFTAGTRNAMRSPIRPAGSVRRGRRVVGRLGGVLGPGGPARRPIPASTASSAISDRGGQGEFFWFAGGQEWSWVIVGLGKGVRGCGRGLGTCVAIHSSRGSARGRVSGTFASAVGTLTRSLAIRVGGRTMDRTTGGDLSSRVLLSHKGSILASRRGGFFGTIIRSNNFGSRAVLPRAARRHMFRSLAGTRPLLSTVNVRSLKTTAGFVCSSPAGTCT